MERIMRVSRVFQKLFLVWMMVLPVLTLSSWVFLEDFLKYGMVANLSPGNPPIMAPFTLTTRVLGVLASLLPLAIDLLLLQRLYRLFGLFAEGMVFTASNVRAIKQAAYLLMAGQVVAPFFRGLTVVVLTMNNPPGHRMLTLGLNSSDLSNVVIAFMILVVAWIMDEGRAMQEEQALVI